MNLTMEKKNIMKPRAPQIALFIQETVKYESGQKIPYNKQWFRPIKRYIPSSVLICISILGYATFKESKSLQFEKLELSKITLLQS